MRTDNKTMANTSESRDDELSRDKYHSKRHHLDREKHTKGHHHEDEDRDSKIHNKRKEYHRHELESNKRGDSKSSRANDDFDRNERRKQINERHRDRGGDDEGDISRGDMRTEKKIRDSAEHSNRRDSSGRSGHKESSKRRGEERENDHRKQSVKREIRDEDDGRNAKYGLQKKVKKGINNDEINHSEPRENLVWGKMEEKNEETKPVEKEKPSFEPSGKLAEDTNTYKGVVIKYNEPPDAHKPKLRWRLYPFKGDEALPVLYIHRQSAYLIGRDRRVADFAVDHPSCSKQHAVFQYRLVPVELDDGSRIRRIKPYIIDLNSANGTYLNNERIEPQRFVELREKDVLKFGFSTREFVLLNEKSNESDSESDHNDMKIPKHSPPSSPSP